MTVAQFILIVVLCVLAGYGIASLIEDIMKVLKKSKRERDKEPWDVD